MTATTTAIKPEPRIGLALGGGGPLGGIYEIGALRALDEALDGLDFNNIDVYVGVNAGSFVAANLANQMTTAQLCRIFVRNEAEVHPSIRKYSIARRSGNWAVACWRFRVW